LDDKRLDEMERLREWLWWLRGIMELRSIIAVCNGDSC